MKIQISKPNRQLVGKIRLDGSKSITNRLRIMQALCPVPFELACASTSKDSTTLERLIAQFRQQPNGTFDAGAAGTTFRFLTAFFAFQQGQQVLTGSERMKQRPIGQLVDALRQLGCTVQYLENEGFPPLLIGERTGAGIQQLDIEASVSSQYITAILMLAPTLPQGLTINLVGKIVSRPYIEMTLGLMQDFGIAHTWADNQIRIDRQAYQPKNVRVEADWSAASYYFAMAIFADKLDIELEGIFENSLQGDREIVEMATQLGIKTTYTGGGVRLTKSGEPMTELLEWNFLTCPDIAQTLAVACGGAGVKGLFSGLETLFIKETDRVAALETELAKVGVAFFKLPPRLSGKSGKQYFMLEEKAQFAEIPTFATYEDHRMAMSFAPLAMFHPVRIAEHMVVEKSYPKFWEDLKTLGFEVVVIED